MDILIFDSWESLIRVAITTIAAYFLLILFLRISGKRTLSKMNAFDLIVTIALGSTLATVILSKDVAIVDGVLALVLLISLQYLITWLSSRYKKVSRLVKSSPTLIVYNGEMLPDAMLKQRVDEDEVYAILREKGFASLSDAGAVVLETDGSLSVLDEVKEGSEMMRLLKK